MNSGKCWLMTTKSSDSRFGWKAGNPLEDEDSGEEGAPWKGDVSRKCRCEFFSMSPAVCEDRGCPGW